MVKDFRPELRRDHFRVSITREEIELVFRKGELIKAGKLCTRLGFALSEFQESIEAGARKLYHAHQAGVVLSFMHETGASVGVNTLTLLKAMYELNDYHGFLKQAHRFKLRTGIEAEIDFAIQRLIDKKQVADAEGWHRKFQTLRNEKPKTT
jgi:hypothetical protein